MKRKVFIVMALTVALLCACFALVACNNVSGGNIGHVHNFAVWTTIKAATCMEGGVAESICTCGERMTKNTPATGHLFSEEWSFDEQSHWHRAICEHGDEVSNISSHFFDLNNQCTVCKYKVGNSIKLETPAISKIEYDTIYWNPVKNADTYTVYVNDNYERTLRGTSCDLEDVLWNGKPISKYGYIRVSIKANGHDDYIESDKSTENTSYYYVPENKSQSDKRDLLVKYSIGFGYNLIEDEYFDSTKCSGKSIFNVSKLLTIGDYTARPHSGGTGFSYNYETMDEFISKMQISVEYKQDIKCVLLGSLKMQINTDIGFDYRKYSYNNTYLYRYDWTYKDHAVTNFASDDLLKYCLADGFVQDVKRESAATYGMNDNQLFKYIFDTYGTHAIIGITTGGSYTAQYVISTNEQDVALKVNAAFNLSIGGGGGLDKIIQKDFGIGISLDENRSWKNESTEAHFKTYIYGGSGGGATSASGVESAIADWTGSLSEDNARSVALTENGAIAVTSLISYLGEIELANGYSDYVDSQADETYNVLYKKYAKPTTVPALVQTENGKNVLRVDLSGFKTSNSLQNAYHPNLINNVFTIYPVMYGKYIDKVVIVGGIDDSSTSDKSLLPFTIRMDGSWGRSAKIVFENCGIECATNDSPVDISELDSEAEPIIVYRGYNIIQDIQGKIVINFEQNNKNYRFVISPKDDEEYNYNFVGVFGNSVYLPVAIKSGYDFVGWKDSDGLSVSDKTGELNSEYISAIGGFVEMASDWVNLWTVKLNNDDATTPGTINLYTMDYEVFYSDIECTKQVATIEVPSKRGYTFGGYYQNNGSNMLVDADGTILSITDIKSDIEVFARWLSMLKFTLNSDGNSYSVSGIGSYDDSQLIIPSEHLGKPVTTINATAFRNCKSITQVTIPSSITNISYYAFHNCVNLVNIIMPNSVTKISGSVFEGCESLTSVTLSENLTSIGARAFYNCSSLKGVNIPVGVMRIEDRTFFGCVSLISIIIPNRVTSIGVEAFYGCTCLTNMTGLSGVTIIDNRAFFGCENITHIELSGAVRRIGGNAFSYCSKLTTIRFNGRKELWNAISKDPTWNNCMGSFAIICIDGTISGKY